MTHIFVPKTKSKKRPVVVVLAFLLLLAALALITFLYYMNELRSPNSQSQKVSFTIGQNQSVDTIISSLKEKGLIKNKFIYKMYLIRSGLASRIQAGEYILNQKDDAETMTKKLLVGKSDERKITILEGWRVEEIGEYLEGEGFSFTAEEFVAAGKSFEGKLFPDTYFVRNDITAPNLISRLNEEFKEKFTPYAGQGNGLTDDEIVILAAIVEREARGAADMKMVAGILRNRLDIGMALETDANVQYALGKTADGKKWWPEITGEQTKSVISPYNTYLNPGLPPGPICNPSKLALDAVVNPTASDNLYYLHGTDGVPRYAQTFEEHLENQRKYL